MKPINIFLKVLKVEGYPNPNIRSLAKMVNYNLDDFLPDLKNEIGREGVLNFCEKAVYKITGNDGLRIDLVGPTNDEYVYVHIYPIFYDEKESEVDIVSDYKWGKSRVLSTDEEGKEEYLTIEETIENADMGEWGEVEDLIDDIRSDAYKQIYNSCGFGILWR